MTRLAAFMAISFLAAGCAVYTVEGDPDGSVDDGKTNAENGKCIPRCDQEKIDFDQYNRPAFDLFYVCIDERIADAAAVISKEVGPVQCQVTPPGDICNLLIDQACVGEIERAGPDTRHIEDEQWCGFCALTSFDIVTRIKGGHYLP